MFFSSTKELQTFDKFTTHEWLPSIDLTETRGKLVFTAELPGLEAKEEQEGKGEHHFFVERYDGTFERRIKLPTLVKTDKIDAKFDKGILIIILPKTKEIKIKVH